MTAIRRAILLALLTLALLGGRARAQTIDLPVRRDGGEVVVRAQDGLDRWADRALARAPGALERIRSDLPDLPGPRVVEIRIVRDAADLGRAAPAGRGAPAWADGVAYGDQGVLVLALWRGGVQIDFDRVLVHELAHLALDAALGKRAPRWLHEGFAYLHSSDWSWGRTQTLVGMAWSGDVIPLADLDRHFRGRENEHGRAYAQSYDLVAYLAQRGRSAGDGDDGDRWAFRSFLAALAAGESLDQAARSVYHASLEELYREWYDSLRQRYLIVPVGLFTLGLWVLAALLLVLAWRRRRRQNRVRMTEWARQEAAEDAAAADPPAEGGRAGAGGDADADDVDTTAPPGARVLH